jgi:hypothetical protein
MFYSEQCTKHSVYVAAGICYPIGEQQFFFFVFSMLHCGFFMLRMFSFDVAMEHSMKNSHQTISAVYILCLHST